VHTLEQLAFAQHFPFGSTAKRVVLEQNLSLENIPEKVVERAELMVRNAFSGKKYLFELHSSDLLLQEILAFPVAKILVSFSNDRVLFQRFSAMVADSSYAFLEMEKDKGKAAVALASELGAVVDFPESKHFFVSMQLQQFLSIPFSDPSLKLVNQFVSNGSVLLDLNGFCRFLREKSYSAIFSSLPVPVKGLPKGLESIAKDLRAKSKAREQKLFKQAFKGKLAPEAFPPCIAQMYGQLASGQKIPHMANFTLATFLNSVGMPKAQTLALFKKSPNFKERIASYQLDRISKQNYAPPSCDKIRSYGFCPNADCRVKHPLGFYRRQMRKGTTKMSIDNPVQERGTTKKEPVSGSDKKEVVQK